MKVVRAPALLCASALIGCAGSARPLPAPQAPEATVVTPVSEAPRPEAVYLLMVDRFANGDPSNDVGVNSGDETSFAGGDLAGVRQRLDHLQGLGITTIWLTPIFAMRTAPFEGHAAFHGYWVHDLGRLAPHLGSEEDLAALRKDVDARGMKLWLDVVWNHVSFDAPLRSEKPSWFHPSRPIVRWDDPVERETHEVHGLPDLAQENPEVFAYLLENTARWLPYADGLRVDAVRHMPLDAQARLGAELEARKGAPLPRIGEVFDGDPTRLAAAWRGGGFTGVFDFPTKYAVTDVVCRGASPGGLAAILSEDDAYPDARALFTFLDNHDTKRIRAECPSDAAVADALALLAHLRGTPVITWGTEWAADGASEPANRPAIRWETPAPLADAVREALDARRAHPALVRGDTRILALNDDLLVFARTDTTETVMVAWSGAAGGTFEGRALQKGLTTWTSDPLPADPGGSVTITLSVTGRAPGDVLFATGTGRHLGAWDPAAGIPLAWDGTAHRATLTLPRGRALDWKPVSRAPDGAVTWYPGANRAILADRDGLVDVARWP